MVNGFWENAFYNRYTPEKIAENWWVCGVNFRLVLSGLCKASGSEDVVAGLWV